MRVFVVAAALVLCCSTPGSAYDLQTKSGQVVCDTLAEFVELTIAIGMNDDPAIEAMRDKGCHLPQPGLTMELIEAYPDQTIQLFDKLAEYTHIGPVPAHIETLTNLAKVRLLDRTNAPIVGFTLLRVARGSESRMD